MLNTLSQQRLNVFHSSYYIQTVTILNRMKVAMSDISLGCVQ